MLWATQRHSVHLHCNGVVSNVNEELKLAAGSNINEYFDFQVKPLCNIRFRNTWRDCCKSRYLHFDIVFFLFHSKHQQSSVLPAPWVKGTSLDKIPPFGTTCNITITSSVRYPGNVITLDTCYCGNCTLPKMKYWIYNKTKTDPIN